ncbi:MAG: ribosomal protein S18-alanine N-acetyltransferase [Oscillospiraceae bacterium]|nr:ribosomal protein S18-alanine N-acetyltransferase [Oscillospiraceae bacterium]
MTVRRAAISDIPQIAVLESECFSAPWSEDALLGTMERDEALFFVAECAGEICGYIGSYYVLDEGYITNVAVSEKMRRHGVGRELITALKKEAEEKKLSFLTLEVRVGNTAAITLYSSLGFENLGRRPRFYRDPTEDAYIMTWNIT